MPDITAKEQLEKWDKILDEYETGLGLPNYTSYTVPLDEMETYLQMNRDVLEKLSAEECRLISVRLAQFSFHLKRAFNREKSRIKWVTRELKNTIAMELNNYKGYGYDEKASQAIKMNSHASKLSKIQTYAESRADRLEGLSDNLKTLAGFLRSVQYSKYGNNNE